METGDLVGSLINIALLLFVINSLRRTVLALERIAKTVERIERALIQLRQQD